MCILSFPALCFSVSRKSNRWDADSTLVQVEEDSIDNVHDNHCKFSPYEYQVLIKPGGLPSSCELMVQLDTKRLKVCLQRNPKYIQFKWEGWRDAFQGRLEGLRKWHLENWRSSRLDHESRTKKNQVPIPLESHIGRGDNRYPIDSGIVEKELVGAGIGIGDRLKIWKGWLPHRRNICYFELTSKNLIKTRKSLDFKNQKIKVCGKPMTIRCPQIQYKSEKYADCDRVSLQRCMVISSEEIRKLSFGCEEDTHNSGAELGETLRKLAD